MTDDGPGPGATAPGPGRRSDLVRRAQLAPPATPQPHRWPAAEPVAAPARRPVGNRWTPLVLLVALAAIVLSDAGVIDAMRSAVAADLAADRGGTGPAVKVGTVRARVATPVAVGISRLGISSSLIGLHKTSTGSLQVPKNFQQAGWYAGSARPGDNGPTVLVGHVDSFKGPGVFYRLDTLRKGDLVRVTRADRSVASFRVTSMTTVSKSRFPTAAVYGSTGRPALRLITCGGRFDRSSGHYLSNTIVFASYVGSTRPATAAPRPFLVRGSAPVRPLPVARPRPAVRRPAATAPAVRSGPSPSRPADARSYLRHRAR